MKDVVNFAYNATCNRYALPFIVGAFFYSIAQKQPNCRDEGHKKPRLGDSSIGFLFSNLLTQCIGARVFDYLNNKQSSYEAIVSGVLSGTAFYVAYKVSEYFDIDDKGPVLERHCSKGDRKVHGATNITIGEVVSYGVIALATTYAGDKSFRDYVNSGVMSLAEYAMGRS